MAKRRRKNNVASVSSKKLNVTSTDVGDEAQLLQDHQRTFRDQELERRIASIRAIQEAEVHSMLTCIRVLRSEFSKEQLETPALNFFQENLPNLVVVRNEDSRIFALRPSEITCGQERASGLSSVGDLRVSVKSARHSFLNAVSLQIPDLVLDGSLEDRMPQSLGSEGSFQTPGGMSSRLSSDLRHSKQGEIPLSAHGSSLGANKEKHLEAIPEIGAFR